MKQQTIYFLSDFHLPVHKDEEATLREQKIIRFLEQITPSAEHIFLLGDVFDFWFEYRLVVPKGYVRLLGTLAKLADSGIQVHYFVGNHDMWLRDYFTKELGIKVYHHPEIFEFQQKRFYIGHGDGLGKGQYAYKLLKFFLFRNRLLYPLVLALFHPDWMVQIGDMWSTASRKKKKTEDETRYLGDKKEHLTQFCIHTANQIDVDFFIFGHRHLPLQIDLGQGRFYFNTGDLIHLNSYVLFEKHIPELAYL